MADDLIPAAIQNGGTGSVQVGQVRAPDYRQVANPIRPLGAEDLPNSGAAARAQALANTFKDFEDLSANVNRQAQLQAGALAGAASGDTGHPQYKQGLSRFTAYGQAFNNAATGAYAIEAEAQADDSAARLRVQANNNADTFAATYQAYRDGVLKEAPAQAVPMLTELYNKRLATNLAAIRGDQLQQQQQLQRQTYDEGVQRLTSQVATLQGSDNPEDQAAAADQHVKLSLLIDGGVKAGLYSEAEAQSMHIAAMRTITAQVFQTQVDRELQRPDGRVDILLNQFRDAHLANLSNKDEAPILSEPEFQKLMADATTKTREYRLFQEMEKQNMHTAEQEKFQAGDRDATSQFFRGQLTISALDAAVRNKDVTPERATALYNQLQQNAANGKGNSVLAFKLRNDPQFLDMKPADISRYVGPGGLNGVQAESLAKEIETRNNGYESTQQFKQGKDAIAAELKIPPGDHIDALDPEKAKAYTNAVQEYRQIVDGLEPSKRTAGMAAAAQTAIATIKRQEAAAQVTQLQNDIKSVTAAHGPGSASVWSKDKMDAYIKQKNEDIARAQAAAKGP